MSTVENQEKIINYIIVRLCSEDCARWRLGFSEITFILTHLLLQLTYDVVFEITILINFPCFVYYWSFIGHSFELQLERLILSCFKSNKYLPNVCLLYKSWLWIGYNFTKQYFGLNYSNVQKYSSKYSWMGFSIKSFIGRVRNAVVSAPDYQLKYMQNVEVFQQIRIVYLV